MEKVILEDLLSVNPYTKKEIARFKQYENEQVDRIIESADLSFRSWKTVPHSSRCAMNHQLSLLLETNKHRLAALITAEMGKPLLEAIAEIEKCAWLCEYYANPASSYIPPEKVETGAKSVTLTYEPLGPLFAIMPWNFPFWQVFRFAVPAITAGNVVILKHAPNVTNCALEIEKLFLEAGFPANVFRVLLISADRSELVIGNELIRGVTLTGSERAGRAVAALAGKYLKKVVLELGGSDAFIVFPDAAFLGACTTGLTSRMMNAGQVCIAAKRFIVHESIFDQFVDYQIAALSELQAGDPMKAETKLGPMARPDLLENLEEQLRISIDMGAKLLIGGKRHPQEPTIFLPTILTKVEKGMPVLDDETFGPLMVIIPFRTEDEAVSQANDTRFGLGCSIWTQDEARIERLLPQIQTGAVFVNSLVKSDPRVPFGGIKNSGFGRELSIAGIKEFMNLKTNWIN